MGVPSSKKDLKSVSVDKAATVLIMQPDCSEDNLKEAILSQAKVDFRYDHKSVSLTNPCDT